VAVQHLFGPECQGALKHADDMLELAMRDGLYETPSLVPTAWTICDGPFRRHGGNLKDSVRRPTNSRSLTRSERHRSAVKKLESHRHGLIGVRTPGRLAIVVEPVEIFGNNTRRHGSRDRSIARIACSCSIRPQARISIRAHGCPWINNRNPRTQPDNTMRIILAFLHPCRRVRQGDVWQRPVVSSMRIAESPGHAILEDAK
jgi:hypothetical protein